MAISSELEQLLASWIPRQSWFPKLAADFGTDPDITPMSVARAFTFTAEELGGFSGLVTVISVGDGPTLRRLNIPLSLRGAEDIHLRHALIGTVDDLALGRVFVYDGAADPVFVNLLADAITKRKVFDGGQLSTESLRHSRERGSLPTAGRTGSTSGSAASASAGASTSDSSAEAVPPKPETAPPLTEVKDEIDVEIRPIEVADSGANKSTVVIHDAYEPIELIFFRVLENGMPSSLTIPVLLTEAGSRSVPEVIGWSSGRWYDMFEVTEMEAPMALLSRADVEAEPAWREAVDIVCAVDSGSIGGYNAQAAEMGRRIGELHADMAAEFGIVEGRGAPTKEFVDKWVERIDWALGRAPLALDALVPELKQHKAKLRSLDTIGQLQKIHGELTLDHVVSSPSDGYAVVKFSDASNSEPRPVALDLVALLRSVDYAAGFARLQRTDALSAEDGSLVVNGFGDKPAALRAIYDSPEYLWASQVQNSLLSGYSRARGESIGLSDPVLRAALIDRLLVETVTELRNRPNWLSVPLATLTLILKGKPARGAGDPTEAELSVPASGASAGDGGAGDATGESGDERSASPESATARPETTNDAEADDAELRDDVAPGDNVAPRDDAEVRDGAARDDDRPSGSGAAFVAGAAGVVGAAGIAGAATASSEESADERSDADAPDTERTESRAADSADGTSSAGQNDRASDVDAAGQTGSVSDVDAATGLGGADDSDTDEVATASASSESATATPRDVGLHDTPVDAVSAEAVSTTDESIADMVADGGGFTEPSVEAPTDAQAGTERSGGRTSDPYPAVTAESASADEAVTTSVRGTTVTRTLFIQHESTKGSSSGPDLTTEGSYVDGVTTEAVEPVDERVPEVDPIVSEMASGDSEVNGLVEADVEAIDEPADSDETRPVAESESTTDTDSESRPASESESSVDADAPPLAEEPPVERTAPMPDAPPLPPEPPEYAPDMLPDAPRVAEDETASAVAAADDEPIADSADSADHFDGADSVDSADSVPASARDTDTADEVTDSVDADASSEDSGVAEAPVRPAQRPGRPAPGGVTTDEDEFDDEEESEFVVSRVPATFAARGATSADADSTGRAPTERHKHDGGPAREVPGENKPKNGKNKH
ncbi:MULTISPECIES: maltokinase N-terminal cap-like domain-containing protein [Brevibacterium]|uniref:maltokinase N-terminal cap-like domain-containing protein n=1 Tax=Brevibacterium TaxID=1696 RepID=UPI001BACE210|nr:hypothetical protein [Brevibacterium sp. W7.2]